MDLWTKFWIWNANNLHLILNGDANDYVGKGMNGGRIVIKNNFGYASVNFCPCWQYCLYGATGGGYLYLVLWEKDLL